MSARARSRAGSRVGGMPRRLGVFGLLFILLASRVGLELHWALVRHTVCAEHGELVELSSAPSSEHAGAHQSEGPLLLPSAGEEHGHEHCLLATAAREQPLTGAGAEQWVAAPAATGVQPAADPSQPWLPFARYLLAPHTSPPA